MPDQTESATMDWPALVLRPATIADIPALLACEERCFPSDRLSRRNFKYLLRHAHGRCLVGLSAGRLAGYALLLFKRGTALARLYSLAVDPQFRDRGIARQLLEAAESAASDHDCQHLRLEVRPDNEAAITLYRGCGYREFGRYPDYYEDHMEALRLEKRLMQATNRTGHAVPYYAQTLDFTCGPSALMMAMAALDPGISLNRRLELQIWRESTTVFMTTGHGGCAPLGLALSAWKRGFAVDLVLSDDGAPFLDGVRSEHKKAVMRLVHDDMREEIAATGIQITIASLTTADLAFRIAGGAVPVVLISSYRIDRKKSPHWVVVTGLDDRFCYLHDPFVESDQHKSTMDCVDMPIRREAFERMARYGKAQLRAVLLLNKPVTP